MSDAPSTPRHLPRLTEVVHGAPASTGGGAAAPAADAAQIVECVLARLQAQIEPLLAQQVREAMAPALEQAMDRLLHETRLALARTLREQVMQAVAQALLPDGPQPATLAAPQPGPPPA